MALVPPFARPRTPRLPIIVQGGSGGTSTVGMFYSMGPTGLATLGWGTYNILAAYPWSGDFDLVGGSPQFQRPDGSTYNGDVAWTSTNQLAPNKIQRAISWGHVTCTYNSVGNRMIFDLEIANNSADRLVSIFMGMIQSPTFSGNMTKWIHEPGWMGNGGDAFTNGIPITAGPYDCPPIIGIDAPDCVINWCGEDGTLGLQAAWSQGYADEKVPFLLTANYNIISREIRHTRYSMRFYAPGSEMMLIEPDVEHTFAGLRPFTLDWPDRRPVGMMFLASNGINVATNPNKWMMNGGNIDTSTPGGMTAFQGYFLAFADTAIQVLHAYGAQGAVTWDIEGQRVGGTYYGSPELHGDITGGETSSLVTYGGVSMTLADAYFKKFRDAGLRYGVTLRPSQCHFVGGFWDNTDAANEAAAMTDLQTSINYAINRWGCTLFYIDSSYCAATSFLSGDFYKSLHDQFPDVIFFPENQTMGAWATTAPLDSYTHHHVISTPDKVRRVWPRCFQFNLSSSGIAPADEAAVIRGMQLGDVYSFNCWYLNAEAEQIADLYRQAMGIPPPPIITGLAAYWKLDETSGDRLDSSGNGTILSPSSGSIASRAGKIGPGADFVPANSNCLRCASNPSLVLGNIDFTITCWMYVDAWGSANFIEKSGGTYEYALVLSTDGSTAAYVGDAFLWLLAGTLAVGAWSFVVLRHNLISHILSYSVNNGTPVTRSTSTNAPYTGTGTFNIGADTSTTYKLDGIIDEVGIWKRCLTAGEITRLYNGGAGLAYPFT